MNRIAFVRGAALAAAGILTPAAPAAAGTAPPPSNFGANRNYHMYGGGKPLRKIRVTVHIGETIIAPTGMSMQLNGNSPAHDRCHFQQYNTGIDPKWNTLRVGWSIENFPSETYRWYLHRTIGLTCRGVTNPTESTCTGDMFNDVKPNAPFATFPGGSSTRIPAGYQIVYDLIDDSLARIIGADYTVIDNTGRAIGSGPQYIRNAKFQGTNDPVTAAALAPLLAFQMDLVGLHGGEHATLTSGAGRIVYECETEMTPLARLPRGVNWTETVETSNVVYGLLPSTPSTRFVQTFRVPSFTRGSGGSGGGHLINDKAPPTPPIR